MSDGGKVTIKMLLDNHKYKNDIQSSKKLTSDAFKSIGAAGVDAFKGINAVGTKAFKGITAGATATAGAVALLGKSAIEAYSDYEQLVGGVETLFKDSADIVQEYAQNAYKTAGMSANAYMETVTSFSASLLQSLSGDAKKAAKYADMAITDMSDNANKMGTDISMIQNAYQGFAKQNYTMLDNLKIGYGGTKEEMSRLLDDARKITGIKYDISKYSNIVDAIHVIQTEMGITGTTAREAATTIQGSVSMMKGAWENLVVGMAGSSQDVGKLADELIDSVVVVAKNLIPRIKELVPGMATGLTELITGLIPEIAPMLENALAGIDFSKNAPKLGKSIAIAFTAALKLIPQFIEGGSDVLAAIIESISENSDEAIATAEELVNVFFNAIVSIGESSVPLIEKIVPVIVKSIVQYSGTVFELGVTIITAFIDGLVANSNEITQMAIDTLLIIVDAIIDNIDSISAGAASIITELARGLAESSDVVVNAVLIIVQTILNVLRDPDTMTGLTNAAAAILAQLALGIAEAIPMLLESVPLIVDSIITALCDQETLEGMVTAAVAILTALLGALINNTFLVFDFVAQLCESIVKVLLDTDWAEVGKSILQAILDALIPTQEELNNLIDRIVYRFSKGKYGSNSSKKSTTSGTSKSSGYTPSTSGTGTSPYKDTYQQSRPNGVNGAGSVSTTTIVNVDSKEIAAMNSMAQASNNYHQTYIRGQ